MALPATSLPGKRAEERLPYLGTIVCLLLLIFGAELLIMSLLPYFFPEQSPLVTNLLDAIFLALISAPVVWLLVAKPLRDAAQSERDWSEALLGQMNDGIVILNRHGVVITLNSAAEKIFLCKTEEVSGKPFSRLVSFTDTSHQAGRGSQERYDNLTLSEATGWRKGTIAFPVEISVSSMTRGSNPFIVVILRDMSERKQAELELQRKNAVLEGFLYTVSHDLKTPLVTIGIFLDMIQSDLEKGNVEQVLSDMHYLHNAADKMDRLLEGILELSKSDGALADTEQVSSREIASTALNALAEKIVAGGITVTIADGAVDLIADSKRLYRLWHILLDNALKFLGSQSDPRIETGFYMQNSEPVFFVSDNGIGIDPRYQDRIFGLFEQIDPECGGTGLGLALAKRIVELYGGKLWVESAGLNQGTHFRFTLPGALPCKQKTARVLPVA